MVTIRDVAKAAGVSVATISRTLTKPASVARPTRERVLSVIDRLGYAPNSAAASLRTTKTQKIIVTVPDIANPFFGSVIRGVEEAAQESGYAVLLGDTRGKRLLEEQYANMLHRREADGFIFLGHRLPDTLKDLIAREGASAPVVNGCEFSPSLGVASVHIDNAKAASMAMDALYDLGHRDVSVITGPLSSPLSRDRLVGARGAAERRGLIDRLYVSTGDFSLDAGRARADEILRSHPDITAIFCFNDEMACGALSAVRKANRKCPEDLSIIGFDDIPMARYTEPPLTTIRQPAQAIGRGTVELLLGILNNQPEEAVTLTLPHKLVVRQSVGPAPQS